MIALTSLFTFGLAGESDVRAPHARFDEFAGMAYWAVDLFEEAGLRLPPMRFVYHGDDQTPCRGRRGRRDRSEVDGAGHPHRCLAADPDLTVGFVDVDETAGLTGDVRRNQRAVA
jgi:hypothetical protein